MSVSLLSGGPLHDLAARVRLSGSRGRHVLARALVAVLVTWVPLLVLSAIAGEATGDAVVVTFLGDLTAQVRFLLSVPLLVVASAFVEPRLRDAVRQLERGSLVPREARPALAHVLRAASRLVRSPAELWLLVPVLVAAVFERAALVSAVSNWEHTTSVAEVRLSPAGLWLVAVGLPVYRYLVLRWLWRCAIWAWVQHRLARLPLRLTPSDPDGACGLAALGQAQATLAAPLVLALGAMNAAFVGNRALYLGVPVAEAGAGVALFCACALTLSLAPLLVFSPRLAAARRRGLIEYGVLGTRVARSFHDAWLAPGAAPAKQVLARPDASALADLHHVLDAVRRVRVFPVDRSALRILLIVTITPFVPLIVSQVPPEQALQALRALVL